MDSDSRRSCHDAIEAIFNSIRIQPKYVLDADISKCFDRIDHKQLLRKLNTFPTLGQQIRAWLNAGVVDNDKLFPTSEGTPQGGTLSPQKSEHCPSRNGNLHKGTGWKNGYQRQ